MSLKKRGFTLIELLVVITIIGMLVGLLMPAVQSAREAGRRAQCMNNQHQISTALHQYDSERGSFPGYVGEYRTTLNDKIKQRKISWFVAILPYLGRTDVHDLWKDLTVPNNNPDSPIPGDPTVANNVIPSLMMRIAICPSFSPPSPNDSWLSYRVNVGRMTPNAYANDTTAQKLVAQAIPAEGVFTDQFQDKPSTPASLEIISKIGLGFIDSKDGSSCTLMLGENSASVPPQHAFSQDGKWAPLISDNSSTPEIADGAINTTYYQNRHNATVLGFNWCDMDPEDPNRVVNFQAPDTKVYSNHPGGIVASFCDGHQFFLRNDIEQVVYMQLMCPSDRDVYSTPNYGIKDPILKTPNPVPPLSEDKY